MQVSCTSPQLGNYAGIMYVHHLSWETMQISCTSPQLGNYATIMYITSAGKLCNYHVHHLSCWFYSIQCDFRCSGSGRREILCLL